MRRDPRADEIAAHAARMAQHRHCGQSHNTMETNLGRSTRANLRRPLRQARAHRASGAATGCCVTTGSRRGWRTSDTTGGWRWRASQHLAVTRPPRASDLQSSQHLAGSAAAGRWRGWQAALDLAVTRQAIPSDRNPASTSSARVSAADSASSRDGDASAWQLADEWHGAAGVSRGAVSWGGPRICHASAAC